MRAIVCRALGDIDSLVFDDVPDPPLLDGGVRIAVEAAGINFADTLIIAGKYQIRVAPPFSPGFEVAGRVLEVAEGVSRCRPGDRVMAVIECGGFAEEVVAPQDCVFVLPAGVDPVVAAGFPIAYGTSHLALTFKAGLRPGETLLVHGAAGGVGLTAVEIGKRLGARVIATAGGAAKLAVATAAGADVVLDSRSEGLRDAIRTLTDGRGVDVVYDPVGGPLFEASLRATAGDGRILLVGFASGEVPQIPANILLVKNITAIGFYWGAYRTLAPEAMKASCEELVRWLGEGSLHPHVSQTFPLEDAAQALHALKARKTTGKVVLLTGR
ncbi:MAG: NADPH:quinone oxidoreductase family protein [Rhodospirillales bacterium]|nr:NADPH:quinone oxidoreductase family protein [Rhodospirillales bacterium]